MKLYIRPCFEFAHYQLDKKTQIKTSANKTMVFLFNSCKPDHRLEVDYLLNVLWSPGNANQRLKNCLLKLPCLMFEF